MVKEEDPRFRHLKTKIAVFVAVAVTAVAAIVLFIGKEHDLFTAKYRLSFTVDKGTGFTRGMPVKLSGFRIGRVKSIELNDAAKVDIVLQIDKKYRKWIRKDSTAKLVKEGMVGDAIVDISVGSPGMAALNDGDKLAYVKTKALDELADEIAASVKPVLLEVRDIIGYVNDPKGDIKQTMRQFNMLSKNLEGTRQKADLFLVRTSNRVDGLSEKLSLVLDDSSVAVKKATVSLARVDEKLPGLLDATEKSLVNLEKISGDLKQTEVKVLPMVPQLVQKTGTTLEGAGTVIDAVKGLWPISSHIPAPKEKLFVPGDSHE